MFKNLVLIGYFPDALGYLQLSGLFHTLKMLMGSRDSSGELTLTQPMSAYPPGTPPAKKSSNLVKIAVLVIVVGAVIAVIATATYYGGSQIYQSSLRPNIQTTSVAIGASSTHPQTTRVLDDGRVANQGSFDYTTTLPGTYSLYFDNSFSIISDKSVSVSYATGSTSDSKSFSVSPGAAQYIYFNLDQNARITGTFTVSGGSGNDVNFYITAATCTQTIPFSFTLVNPGQADGFANVHLLVDGNQANWSNRYFVAHGQQVPESGSVTLNECSMHTLSVVVDSQEKA